MNRISRRTLAPVALFWLALALAAPVSAADADDIVFDASVTVVFVQPPPDGTPIPGANVMLEARITDFPDDDPLAVLRAITDDNGIAVFEGVPRGAEGGPTVHLAVAAQAERQEIDGDLCRTTETWSGFVVDVPSPPAGPVVVTVIEGTSSLDCRFVSGRIVDADGNPHPADPELSSISIDLPDGGGAMAFPLAVEDDGSFRQPLPVWGTFESPAVLTVRFVGTPETETVDGCVATVAEAVTWEDTVALESEDAPILDLITAPVGGDTCGALSPTSPPAVATLPPTDLGTAARPSEVVAFAVQAFLALVLVGCGVAVGAARVRR